MNILDKRNLAKGLGPVLLLSAALALPAAATAQPSRYGYGSPYPGRNGGARSVDGFITYRGGSCPAIRDHRSGQSYSLAGGTRELRPGDHVVLSGSLTSGSACGTRGPALQVLEIRTIWTGGDHRAAYFDARRDGSFQRFILRSRDRGGWYSDRYTYLRQGRAPQGGGRYGAPYGAPDGRARPNDVPYDEDRGQYRGQAQGQPQGQAQGQPDDQGQYDQRPQPNEPNDSYDNGPDRPDDQGYVAPNDMNDTSDQGDRPEDRQDDRADRSSGNRQLVTVDGTFEFDSTCPSLRGTDGKSYDLAGELGSSHDGDRVRVRGFLAGRSSCGGTALEVQEIRRR
jgi:hypothetical protein